MGHHCLGRCHVCFAVRAVMTILLTGAQLTHVGAQEGNRADDGGRVGAADNERVRLVNTGLIVRQIASDAHGHFVCVFGQPAPPPTEGDTQSRRDRQVYLRGGPTHVVSVDLKTYKVSGRHPVDGDVQQALIDDQYLYWKPKSVNVVNRLTMSEIPTLKQLSPQGPVEAMFFVGDDRLALVVSEGISARLHIYDRRSFSRLPDDPLGRLKFWDQRGDFGRLVQHIGDGELQLSPQIIDQDTGKTKCMTGESLYTPSLAPHALRTLPQVAPGRGHISWHQRESGEAMRLLGGAAPFKIRGEAWSISRSLPLFANVVVVGRGPTAPWHLEIRDVIFGKKMDEVVLGVSERKPLRSGVQFSGENVVVAWFDTLEIVRLTPETLKAAAEPFRLLHPVLPVGSFDRPAETLLEARGGKPPFHFSLDPPIDGIEVDEATGKIRMDFPGIWKRRLAGVASGEQSPFQHAGPQVALPGRPMPSFEERFETSMGVKVPQGMFPTTVRLALTGADSSGQQDRVVAQAIVMVPKEKIEEANVASAELRAAQYARRVAQQRAQQPGSAIDSANEARINDLERRLRRMETKLDAILEKLGKRTEGGDREK